jgi:hypothetical protein
MITRRGALGALTGAFSFCTCGAAHASSEDGCWLDGKEADNALRMATHHYSLANDVPDIIHASGNRLLDEALTQALFRMSRDFDVLPGFGYVRDSNTAHATRRTLLERADGTVLFGLPFLNRLLARTENPDACVVAVCAHEYAHILQYKLKIDQQLDPSGKSKRLMELHADYLSGWFAGLRKRNNPNYPAAVFASLARDSGSQIGSGQATHGAPDERGDAVEKGFLASARDKLALHQAVEAGVRYVAVLSRAPMVNYDKP